MVEGSDPYARAVAGLIDRLEGGDIAPGQPVAAASFAETLGLSPTPVREAMAYLSGRGLLQRHHRHGYAVPPLSASDLIDLLDLQAALLLGPTPGNPLASVLLRVVEIRLTPLTRYLRETSDPEATPQTRSLDDPAEVVGRRDRLSRRAEPLARAISFSARTTNDSRDIV